MRPAAHVRSPVVVRSLQVEMNMLSEHTALIVFLWFHLWNHIV